MSQLLFDSLGITAVYLGIVFLAWLQRQTLPGVLSKQILLGCANLLVLTLLLTAKTLSTLMALALICYGICRWLQTRPQTQAQPDGGVRRIGLTAALMILTALFIILKYEWAQLLVGKLLWARPGFKPDLIQTIGVSYIFFKLVHCLVDAYRGRLFHLNPLTFLNYLFFFPTFLAGPIDRYQNFAAWLCHPAGRRDRVLAKAAFFRIFLGVVKKFLLVPLVVTYAKDFGQVHLSEIFYINVMISLIAYSFYLYFDFSGYSDLAIGVAMLLGFRVPENFAAPYLAQNLGDFWRRWHISLSSILREDIFLPLVRGISKYAPRVPRLAGSIAGYLVTFFICGLWHGNTVNFAIWGLWHGIGLSVHKLWQASPWCQWAKQRQGKFSKPLIAWAAVALTFVYVSAGWLFFNYSLPQIRSLQILSKLAISVEPYYFYGSYYTWGIRLNYRPLHPDDRLDIEFRSKPAKRWISYTSDRTIEKGYVNVYGINSDDGNESYQSLPPGNYEVRIRYQPARQPAVAANWVVIPVTMPDYTTKSNLTADDLEAVARRDRDGWGIQLNYRPPARKFTVDIEVRPPGSGAWQKFQYQRPGRFRSARITGPVNRSGAKPPLTPGVYGVRIRYTHPQEGYFSDWTELAVAVPAVRRVKERDTDEAG